MYALEFRYKTYINFARKRTYKTYVCFAFVSVCIRFNEILYENVL